MLYVGMCGIGITSILGGDPAALMNALGTSSIAPLAKIAVAGPLVYHTMAGARHWYWERYPENLGWQTQRQASTYIIGASAVITGVLAFV
jgi:hypothetical protein